MRTDLKNGAPSRKTAHYRTETGLMRALYTVQCIYISTYIGCLQLCCLSSWFIPTVLFVYTPHIGVCCLHDPCPWLLFTPPVSVDYLWHCFLHQVKDVFKAVNGSFCVKSPNGLNPTDSDFNNIWYTCYLGTHSTKSQILGQSDRDMSKECLDDMKICSTCLYSALYCMFAF